jgi:hypothetical protein
MDQNKFYMVSIKLYIILKAYALSRAFTFYSDPQFELSQDPVLAD